MVSSDNIPYWFVAVIFLFAMFIAAKKPKRWYTDEDMRRWEREASDQY